MATTGTTIRTAQGDTLSAITWRAYGVSSGMAERVLDANPHLANLPTVLPAGVLITLPAAAPIAPKPMLQLWN